MTEKPASTRRDAARKAKAGRAARPGSSPVVRIWADDLTGALDTAAQFTGLLGPLPVLLGGAPPNGSAALDNASRDKPWEAAQSGIADIVAFLAPADLPYLKVDSLLRGHSLKNLAATFARGGYRHCILAPAFPTQGRMTRAGIQLRRKPSGDWLPVGPPLVDALGELGMPARHAPVPEQIEGHGIIVCDADSDEQLVEIVRRGRRLMAADGGRLLWCGSAGLAGALAGRASPTLRPLVASLLLVTGSAHARSRAQQRAFAKARIAPVIEVAAVPPFDPASLGLTLARSGMALLAFRPPEGCDAIEAMRFIRGQLADCLPSLDRPGGLLVSGGETLRAVCETLRTDHLVVCGQVQPGFPVARLVGGIWDGLPVVSKSGAFGDTRSLIDLARTLAPDVALMHGDER